MNQFDVVIVGGGMVGLTLLSSLQPSIDQGLKVCLIDPADRPEQKPSKSPSFDDRATALSLLTLQTLESLGVENLNSCISAINEIEVSDQGHAGFHLMNAPGMGFEKCGAVIANQALGSILWAHCHAFPIQWHHGYKVDKIQPIADGHRLTLSNDIPLETKQVILCDGGRSTLAEQLGLSTASYDFNAYARIASIKTSQAHHGKAFERFTKTGPIALLPFGDYSALVWTIPKSQIAQLPDAPADVLQWLNENFGQRLGRLEAISDWVEYPLVEKQLTLPHCHGFLALGNSAATLHPVAGQGFNLAIRGIVRSAALINQHFIAHHQLPSFQLVSNMVQSILSDQTKTRLFSRELIRTYGSSSVPIQLARGIALNSLDRHPTLSHHAALAGMGLLENLGAQ